MAKSRSQKQDTVAAYRAQLEKASAVYFVDTKGLTAIETSDLKKKLYDLNSNLNVVKNRLMLIALKEEGYGIPAQMEEGQNAVVFSDEANLSAAAKIIAEFNKESKKGEIKAGILFKKVLSSSEVKELAELPGMDQMRAIFLGTLNAPVTGFVTALAGNIRNLGYALNAIKDLKTA